MKRLTLFFLFLFSSRVLAEPSIPQLQHRAISPEATAVYAVWADTGEPILAYNENLLLNPASNTKLITSYCALKELGSHFRFQTKFYSDEPLQNGEIGNLWVKGEGDPAMVNESLLAMVDWLKRSGLNKISGDIYIDDSFFDGANYPGRKENSKKAYNAATSATPFNFNATEVVVKKRKRKKKTVKMVARRTVQNVPLVFGNALVTALQQAGIEVAGTVKMGVTPSNHWLWTWESKPLDEIVQDMNKFSNNFIAEQLTKFLGAKKFGPPATTENGIKSLKVCLAKIGVDTLNLSLENGSGLSYNNRVTAEQLVRVLTAALKDTSVRESFISSLSVDGVDGTMRRRRSPRELQGVLQGKTGSLNNISTLAGFVPAEDGNMIAFAILMNETKRNLAEIHRVQDAIVLEWTRLRKGK